MLYVSSRAWTSLSQPRSRSTIEVGCSRLSNKVIDGVATTMAKEYSATMG